MVVIVVVVVVVVVVIIIIIIIIIIINNNYRKSITLMARRERKTKRHDVLDETVVSDLVTLVVPSAFIVTRALVLLNAVTGLKTKENPSFINTRIILVT